LLVAQVVGEDIILLLEHEQQAVVVQAGLELVI